MLDEDGYLFIGGRSDDTIIRGGENIAPSEIEDVLVEHPDVREVVVVGLDDAEWGQIIVAVIVPEAGAAPTPEQLREFAREHSYAGPARRTASCSEMSCRPRRPARCCAGRSSTTSSRRLPSTESVPSRQQGVRHDQERHAPAEPGV